MQSHLFLEGLKSNSSEMGSMSLCASLDKRILPNLICIFVLFLLRERDESRDGKQAEFNSMIIVIVKCFNYSWTS